MRVVGRALLDGRYAVRSSDAKRLTQDRGHRRVRPGRTSRRSPTGRTRSSTSFCSRARRALRSTFPIAMAIALLLAVVAISYRQTIHAYPNGGGHSPWPAGTSVAPRGSSPPAP